MEKVKFVAFISILFCLLIVIPASFAVDNETVIAISDDAQNSTLSSIPDQDVLNSNDYYYDASIENDNGNGSIDNPYKNLKSSRIQSNSVIHLADGQYALDTYKYTDNLTIIGQNVERTIISYSGIGFYVKNSLTLQNVTLVNLAINDNSNSIINATNVIFKDSMRSSISTSLSETEVYLYNCTFLDNHAFSGAAININKGSLEIINSLFINNHADQYGGAIYIRESIFICRNLEIINSTSKMGGAITALSTNINLINLTARNNGAKYSGGVIYALFGSLSLHNSTFINNSAQKDGGALFIDEVDNFIPFNNTFTNNTAGSIAGAVYSAIGRYLNHYSVLNESLKNSFFNNTASFENDVYECEAININYNSQNYMLIQSDPLYNLTLPSSYDLRNENMVTPVKNQGSNGNCWAFASIASLESCILKATGLTFDLSEENMKDLMSEFSSYGWDMVTNTGGYDRMGHAYLVSWLGPVNESDDKYVVGEVLSPVLNSIFHIQNILFLQRSNYTDNDNIKRAIRSYGAVSTCIHWYQSSDDGTNYYNNGKNIYWYRTDKGANHAVAIVGWDDNYSKNNFKSTPPGDGAWIIKNSWGSSSGENGYYYVSYYDTSLAPLNKPYSTYVFLFNDSIKYDKNYQYDVAGRTDFFLNSSNTVWYKNKFIASDNEYLTAVSTYFEKDTTWDLFIYVNNVLRHTQSGKSTPSYSTIELNDFIPLSPGDIFEVEFKITVDNEASVPISEDIIASGVPINKQLFYENISFISYDGVSWKDLYDLYWSYSSHTYASQVACIKAFTILNPVNTFIELKLENITNNNADIIATVYNEWNNIVKSGNFSFNIHGTTYNVNITNGIAKLTNISLMEGINKFSASFNRIGFKSSSKDIFFSNPLVNTVLNLNFSSSNNPVELVATVNGENQINVYCGEVTFIINNVNYTVPVVDGVARLIHVFTHLGLNNVTAVYNDLYCYNSSNASCLINVSLIKTDLALNVSYDAHNPVEIIAKVVDEHGDLVNMGDIVFTVENENYTVSVVDGVARLVHVFTSFGLNNVSAVYIDSYYYNSSNASCLIKVSLIKTDVALNVSYDAHNPVVIIAKVVDEHGDLVNMGNVVFTVENKNYTVSVVDGVAKLVHIFKSIGLNNVSAVYIDSYYYNSSNASCLINVSLIKTDLALNVSYDAHNPVEISAKVTDEYGNLVNMGNVVFTVENEYYTVKVENGIANLTHNFTNMGINTISARYILNDYYSSSISSTQANVSKIHVKLALAIDKYMDNVTITVNVSDSTINEMMYLLVDNICFTSRIMDSKVIFNLYDQKFGNHSVKAYIISNRYEADDALGNFTIRHHNTILSLELPEYYGNNICKVTLMDVDGNYLADQEIIVTVDKRVYRNYTNADGVALFEIQLDFSNKLLNVQFDGDSDYMPSYISKDLLVKSTILSQDATKTFNSYYTINLIDSEGNPLVNTVVSFIVKYEVYNIYTNNLGIASLEIKSSPGVYSVEIINFVTGEIKTQTIKVIKRITENNVLSMYYGAGKYYKVKVFDDNGNVAKGLKVTFTINNKRYTVNTDSQGYASFKISQKPGKYTITAEYKGFKVSNKITVKSTIVTKDVVVKKGKTIKFTAKLLNKNGKILKNKKVTFKFKGKTYKVKTNKKGKAVLKITKKYNKGKYIIKTSYGGLQIKNKIRIR
jgi:C1A family cysteine protease